MKILYVEDEQNILLPVIKVLKKRGFETDQADNGKTELQLSLENSYDCIILDLNLPEIDGLTVAKKIRAAGITTPTLMLTARVALEDKLDGFKTGADDYLTKPFEMLELIARVNAMIKRNGTIKNLNLKIGHFTLNPEHNELHNLKDKTTVRLTGKETGVLEYLLRNEDKVISAEELLEHVWDANINIFTDTVKTHIKTLRKKLGKSAVFIKTVKGKGYVYEQQSN